MRCKTVVLWCLVNEKEHTLLKRGGIGSRTWDTLMGTLFPGITIVTISEFTQVMHLCVVPALKKRYPELLTTPAKKIKPTAIKEVTEFLPSKGYEWKTSREWRSKFKKLLATD